MKNKKWLWLLIALGLVVLLGRIVNTTKGQSLTPIVYEAPKRDALDSWIEELIDHENCPGQGIIDSNGLRSYGPACFQERTFRAYVKKYSLLQGNEYAEKMNWINDDTFIRMLVKRMIQDDRKNADHWRNTIKKIGQPPLPRTT